MEILIVGGDERYSILTKELKKHNNVDTLENFNIEKYDIIVFPISGVNSDYEVKTINGNFKIGEQFLDRAKKNVIIYTGLITDSLKKIANGKNITSFFSDKNVVLENNIISAEGIIEEVKNNNVKNICILGYGKLGKLLENYLYNYNIIFGVKEESDYELLGRKSFYTRDMDSMKKAFSECNYIINTVPENIITRDVINDVDITILDVSSSPYGADMNTRNYCRNYFIYSGIPGKYAPEKAGKVLLKKILNDIGGK